MDSFFPAKQSHDQRVLVLPKYLTYILRSGVCKCEERTKKRQISRSRSTTVNGHIYAVSVCYSCFGFNSHNERWSSWLQTDIASKSRQKFDFKKHITKYKITSTRLVHVCHRSLPEWRKSSKKGTLSFLPHPGSISLVALAKTNIICRKNWVPFTMYIQH